MKDKTASLNQHDEHGSAALINTVKLKNCSEQLKNLLARPGIDINFSNQYGETALLVAVRKGRLKAAKLLLAFPNIDVNAKSYNGDTALMSACDRGHIRTATILLACPHINVNIQNTYGQTALTRAAAGAQTELIKMLLASPRLDVNLSQTDGYSALMLAAAGSNDIVKLLLAVPGINVNSQNENGETALMIACKCCRLAIIRLLLAAPGIQADLQNKAGETALILAAYSGYRQTTEALLTSQKVDVNLVTKSNQTALEAAKNYKIKALLRTHGAKPPLGKLSTALARLAPSFASPCAALPTADPQVMGASASTPRAVTNVVAGYASPTIAAFNKTVAAPSSGPAATFSAPDTSVPSNTTAAITITTAAHNTPFASCRGPVAPLTATSTIAACSLPASGALVVAPPAKTSSWLGARLLMSGMAEPSVRDCEQKLVHNEGFSNVRDFAECPPAEFTRDYLVSIGISGLGTQRHILRLYNELHSVYRQQAPLLDAVKAPPSVTMETGTAANRDSSDSFQSDSDSNSTHSSDDSSISTCVLSSDGSGRGRGNESNTHKRSRAEAFECDSTPSEHAFVPSYPNKK